MSFKIPRLTFTRRQSEIIDESFLSQTRSLSQEKSSSSQHTSSSLFSRDEFEDSLSQSQPDDSQCLWSSLRKLWKPEEYNDDDRKEQYQNIIEMSEILEEIFGLLEEINVMLSELNCEKKQVEENTSIKNEVICHMKLLMSFVKNHFTELKMNEKLLESVAKSQNILEGLVGNLLKLIQSQTMNSKLCTDAVIKQCFQSSLELMPTNISDGSDCGLKSNHTIQKVTETNVRNTTVADVSESFSQFNLTDHPSYLCSKTLSPTNKSTVFRMRFQKTPLTEQRRRNLRSAALCRGFMSIATTGSESRFGQKETAKARIRCNSIRNGRTNDHHFSNLFVPSPDDSDNSDSISLSSLSDF